jgi:hypothetical protein
VKLVSFGGAFFILPGERGVVAKEGLWMVFGVLKSTMTLYPEDKVDGGVLENPGIPLPFRV